MPRSAPANASIARVSLLLIGFGLLLSAQAPLAAPDPVPSVGKRYWDRAVTQMVDVLTRLDNYTCILHMSRYETVRLSSNPRKVDSVRLQVTALGGTEYYSLPGNAKTVTNPRELVPTGMVANGIFQSFAHSIFVERALTKLEFLGGEEIDGQRVLRYRFQMDAEREPLEIRFGHRRALAAAKGEFWLSEADLNLRRVIVENVEPISSLGVRRALYLMDWSPVNTRSGKFLLPEHAETWLILRDGAFSRNIATLAQCREYQAESSIRFDMDEAEEQTEAAPAAEDTISTSGFLPGGLKLAIHLEDSLDLANMSVGDAFHATLTMPVERGGTVILHKGAELVGRIRRVESVAEPQPHSVAWLEFSVLRSGGTEYTFLAELVGRDPLPQLVDRIDGLKRRDSRRAVSGKKSRQGSPAYPDFGDPEPGYQTVPGVGVFLFLGGLPRIPAGYSMEWKTVSAKP